jgi:hypothetical protein
MHRVRGSLAFSVAVLAAAELSYNPSGYAQAPPPQVEPEVQVQGNNVAPSPAQPYGQPPQPYAPAPPPYGQPPPPYAAAPPPYAYGPIVTLRADNPRARLQMMGPLKWQDVCLAPCNVPVNPAGAYRVGGGTIRSSETFQMPRQAGPVVIDAQVGSKVKHGVGLGLTIGGALAAVVGGIYFAAGSDNSSSDDPYYDADEAFQVVGITYLVIGAVLMAIGIPLSTSHTSVTIR